MLTREEFAKLADEKYDEIRALKDKPTLLDYEQGFVELWTELGRQVAESNLDPVGNDRRKKRKLAAPSDNSKS